MMKIATQLPMMRLRWSACRSISGSSCRNSTWEEGCCRWPYLNHKRLGSSNRCHPPIITVGSMMQGESGKFVSPARSLHPHVLPYSSIISIFPSHLKRTNRRRNWAKDCKRHGGVAGAECFVWSKSKRGAGTDFVLP